MKKWQIIGTSGMTLGVFETIHAIDALHELAERAGFKSFWEMERHLNSSALIHKTREYRIEGDKILL